MNFKKLLLISFTALFIKAGYSSCTLQLLWTNFTTQNACSNTSITVNGAVQILTVVNGVLSPCPAGGVNVQLEKKVGSTWTAVGSTPTCTTNSLGAFSLVITSASFGTGNYRIHITAPSPGCSCSSCNCSGSESVIYPDPVSTPNGCVITFLNTPTADAGMDQTICLGDCAIVGVGGRTPANTSYSWNPTGSPVTGFPKEAQVCPTSTTTYTLTVTDNNTDCSATDVVTITVVDGPQCDNDFMVPNRIRRGNNEMEKGIYLGTGNQILVSIYPNPSTGKFTVELGAEISGTVEVYNMLGAKVLSFKKETNNTRYEVDLTGHPTGVYTVRMESNGKLITQKLILQ